MNFKRLFSKSLHKTVWNFRFKNAMQLVLVFQPCQMLIFKRWQSMVLFDFGEIISVSVCYFVNMRMGRKKKELSMSTVN